jgi:hypothetical protein
MNIRLGTSIAPTRNGSKSGNKEFIRPILLPPPPAEISNLQFPTKAQHSERVVHTL